MKSIPKIAVIGGAGRTGSYIVNQLIEKGFRPKLLIRNPQAFTIENSLVEVVKGDVLDAGIVERLMEDCQAVISTVGQRKDEPLVAGRASLNIVNAIKKQPNPGSIRYILLAGLNVDTPFDKKSPKTQKATDWMKQTFPAIHQDRQKAYGILAESDVTWTLVRVPFIEFNDEKGVIKESIEDCPGSKISAGDIARFMIRQLVEDGYLRQAPFISN